MWESVTVIYCQNGHRVGDLPEHEFDSLRSERLRQMMDNGQFDEARRMRFCTECGAESVFMCESCETVLGDPSKRPSYCGSCGKPFPWTETALAAAREYTDELAVLSQAEKTELKATFKELTTDTARTPLAASRFKRLVEKLAPTVGETLRKIIVDVITDTAKKALTGG